MLRKNLLVAVLLPLIAACAHDVSVTTSSRIYEELDTNTLTAALPKAYTHAGYIVAKAKLEKTDSFTVTDGKKQNSTVYTYGAATLPDGDCMKLSSARVTVMPIDKGRPIHMVQMQTLDATCYNAIKKVNFSIETNPAIYEQFFSKLDEVLGRPGIKIGVVAK